MKMIQVTQSCIDRGLSGIPDKCPVALALIEAGHVKITVGARTLSIGATNPSTMRLLSNEARLFIEDFDAGNTVEPFEFDFDTFPKVERNDLRLP